MRKDYLGQPAHLSVFTVLSVDQSWLDRTNSNDCDYMLHMRRLVTVFPICACLSSGDCGPAILFLMDSGCLHLRLLTICTESQQRISISGIPVDSLTPSTLGKLYRRRHIAFFSYFSHKTGFDISCKLSADNLNEMLDPSFGEKIRTCYQCVVF